MGRKGVFSRVGAFRRAVFGFPFFLPAEARLRACSGARSPRHGVRLRSSFLLLLVERRATSLPSFCRGGIAVGVVLFSCLRFWLGYGRIRPFRMRGMLFASSEAKGGFRHADRPAALRPPVFHGILTEKVLSEHPAAAASAGSGKGGADARRPRVVTMSEETGQHLGRHHEQAHQSDV